MFDWLIDTVAEAVAETSNKVKPQIVHSNLSTSYNIFRSRAIGASIPISLSFQNLLISLKPSALDYNPTIEITLVTGDKNEIAISDTRTISKADLTNDGEWYVSRYSWSGNLTLKSILNQSSMQVKTHVKIIPPSSAIITDTTEFIAVGFITINLYDDPSGVKFTSDALWAKQNFSNNDNALTMNDTENFKIEFSGDAWYQSKNDYIKGKITSLKAQLYNSSNELIQETTNTINSFPYTWSLNQAFYHNAKTENVTYLLKCTYRIADIGEDSFTIIYELGYNGGGKSLASINLISTEAMISSKSIEPHQEYGYNQLKYQITFTPIDSSFYDKEGQLYLELYRKSGKDQEINYAEDFLVTVPIDPSTYSASYIDTTVEAGCQYTYAAKIMAATGDWGVVYKTLQETPVLSDYMSTTTPLVFEDILLTTRDQILKIRYNPDVSGLKYNTSDSITTTLGSAYPFVRRNGSQKYRTFQLKGLVSLAQECGDITDYLDDAPYLTGPMLTGVNALVKDSAYKDRCQAIRESALASEIKERLLEKEYREAISAFLCNPSIKLFKSLSEGNILVYINNVSLTPETKLGRSIYSISCQCTEVAEANVASYSKYLNFDKPFSYIWPTYSIVATIEETGVTVVSEDDSTLPVTEEINSWTI